MRGQILRTGQAEVVAGLVVDAGEIVRPCEIEPHRGQRRPQRENRLEPLRRKLRPAKLELDPTEQEQPLDPSLLTGRPPLLEEDPCVLESPGLDEQPGDCQVRDFGPGDRPVASISRPLACLRSSRGRPRSAQR